MDKKLIEIKMLQIRLFIFCTILVIKSSTVLCEPQDSQIDLSNLGTPVITSDNNNGSKLPVKLFNKTFPGKRKLNKKSILEPEINGSTEWKCPNITSTHDVECGCDLPHTLRCSGNLHGLEMISKGLRESEYSVSLLDCTLKNVTFLSDAKIFENVSLNGLVISSGEIKRVHRSAFLGIKVPLRVLGLPNNALMSVPSTSLSSLNSLDRLDLSNNKIKFLGSSDFTGLQQLTFLELSENQISTISPRTFVSLTKLQTLKLNGNRLGDFPKSLQAIGQCKNLRELDLKSNQIKGALDKNTIPALPLESLSLERNILTSVQNGALEGFPYLITLSLRHNQIDVLQDHAFSGLGSLQNLDLGHNGIVAVSGSSLQHLPKLLVLDMTHNFLRALTSDLIAPLPSLKELRLDGNDISIVAKDVLDGPHEIHSLSLLDNPLACDCTLKPFAEWLAKNSSKISSKDLLGAVCATPPHLEGAPLLQIPPESLSCEGNDNEFDNSNILKDLEIISKQTNNLSHVMDLSDVITLKEIHFSTDYGLILSWSVNLTNDEFTCDAIFVYKEANLDDILMDNSPIQCESSSIGNENIVSVILPNSSTFEIGESYRFCLVLLKEKNVKTNLIVGCSNITKLLEITPNNNIFVNRKINNISDISSLDKISGHSDEITKLSVENSGPIQESISFEKTTLNEKTVEFFNNISSNRSFIPGLGLGILVTSCILLWAVFKLKTDRERTSIRSCYASASVLNNAIDNETRNRYVKLQATTTL